MRTGAKQNEQLPEVTVADSSRTLVEDSQPPEVCVAMFSFTINPTYPIGSDSRTTT